MSIISKSRKQNAIYWPPGTVDDFGMPSVGALVELVLISGTGNFRVRWEGRAEEFLDPNGTTQISNAVVYVPALPGGGEVEVGGFLWLGDRADLTDEADPKANPGAWEVRRVDKLPNLKASEWLRTVYL